MPHAFFSLTWFGDRCLRLSFAQAGSKEAALAVVHAAFHRLSAPSTRPRGLLDLTPAYETLLLTFDPMTLDDVTAEREVASIIDSATSTPAVASPRLVEIPTCYDPAFGPDLLAVADRHSLSPAEVVRLHSEPEYTVAFLGFSPGFPYLAGLHPELHTPRHDQPRAHVPAGSVAIAGDQAGIYPEATPGGWRIIGRTSLELFNPRRAPPALLAPGDRVRFVPISLDQFRMLGLIAQERS